MIVWNEPAPGTAWDCDPDAHVECEPYDDDLDEEDAAGDWQWLVLDRFGDRMVCDSLFGR